MCSAQPAPPDGVDSVQQPQPDAIREISLAPGLEMEGRSAVVWRAEDRRRPPQTRLRVASQCISGAAIGCRMLALETRPIQARGPINSWVWLGVEGLAPKT